MYCILHTITHLLYYKLETSRAASRGTLARARRAAGRGRAVLGLLCCYYMYYIILYHHHIILFCLRAAASPGRDGEQVAVEPGRCLHQAHELPHTYIYIYIYILYISAAIIIYIYIYIYIYSHMNMLGSSFAWLRSFMVKNNGQSALNRQKIHTLEEGRV